MVQAISAEPGFGRQLPTVPIRVSIPSKWNIAGTAADFFISVSHAGYIACTLTRHYLVHIFCHLKYD